MRLLSILYIFVFHLRLHATLAQKKDETTSSTSVNTRIKITLDKATVDNELGTTSNSAKIYPTVPGRLETEDSYDKELVKVLLTMSDNGIYYDANMKVGGEDVGLRLDLLQPEVWVMNSKDFYNCNYLDNWYSSELSRYGSSMPALVTDASEYIANVCARQGAYTMESESTAPIPSPTKPGIFDNQPFSIPYLNGINVSGVFATENISFTSPNNKEISLRDFSFVNADDSDVFVGGLGLAGNPTGSGFLDSLVANDIIKSTGYSLWFNNYSESNKAIGELIPGMVDKRYYSGAFFEFNIPDHEGFQYPYDKSVAIDKLNLPILPLWDIEVENQNNHRTISLKSDGLNFPVLLDSRSVFNYLPLYMIVNLAIQTNASYSSDVKRWVVDCDQLSNLNATLNFRFGDLNVKAPLDNFLINASYNNRNLTFSSRRRACFLSFLPSSVSGYTALGLPFLRSIYLAVDNAGGKIAVANANYNLDAKKSDFISSKRVKQYSTSLGNLESETGRSSQNNTINESIAYIESGRIPFATIYNSTENMTLTYMSLNFTNFGDPSIPAVLSGIIIKSGEVFVTQSEMFSETESGTDNKKSYGNRIEPPVIFDKSLDRKLISLSAGVLISIICIVML